MYWLPRAGAYDEDMPHSAGAPDSRRTDLLGLVVGVVCAVAVMGTAFLPVPWQPYLLVPALLLALAALAYRLRTDSGRGSKDSGTRPPYLLWACVAIPGALLLGLFMPVPFFGA